MRALRVLVTPRWLAVHLGVVALSVAMVLLGRWQLDVSDAKHFDLQNFFYAFQWWTFTAFALYFWWRVMRDALHTAPPPEPGSRLVAWTDRPGLPTTAGAALMAGPDRGGEPPAVYRGYVMPQAATDPDRRGDDRMRSPYNDYLWQLALADAAKGEGPVPTAPRELVDLRSVAPGRVPGRVRAGLDRAAAPVVDAVDVTGPVEFAAPSDGAVPSAPDERPEP